jgi:hypothetical protein
MNWARIQVYFSLPEVTLPQASIASITKVLNDVSWKTLAVDELTQILHRVTDLRQLFYFGDSLIAHLEDALINPEHVPILFGPVLGLFIPLSVDFCSLSGTILGLDAVRVSTDFIHHAFSRMAELAVNETMSVLNFKLMQERKARSEGLCLAGLKVGEGEPTAGMESRFSALQISPSRYAHFMLKRSCEGLFNSLHCFICEQQ